MKEKMLKSVMLTAIIALTVTSSSIHVGYGQNSLNVNDQISFDALLGLFEKANSTAHTVLALIEERGGSIPDAVWSNYNKGRAIAMEAMQLQDERQYAVAKEKILEAMRRVRGSLLSVAEDLEEVETPEEREDRLALGMEEAVERMETIIERLSGVAERAEGRGIDVSRIRERLSTLADLIVEIKDHIEAGDVSEAAKLMSMSQREFGEAMKNLKPLIETYKADRAERFFNMTEERLSNIITITNNVIVKLPIPIRIRDAVSDRVKQAIQRALDKKGEVRRLLQEGRTEDAMAKLNELIANIHDITAEVKQRIPNIGETVGDALEYIDRYKVVLGVLESRAHLLSEKGVETSALLANIKKARDLIVLAVKDLKDGNLQAVKSHLTQVMDTINKIKKVIYPLEGWRSMAQSIEAPKISP